MNAISLSSEAVRPLVLDRREGVARDLRFVQAGVPILVLEGNP